MRSALRRHAAVRLVAAVLASAGFSAALAAPAFAQTTAAAVAPAMGRMQGQITIHGKTIAYRGEAVETVLRNAAGQPRATVFSTSYLMNGADAKTRPVTFLYNGGPGSATIALREGLGPKRITGAATRGEFAFIDNPDSLLDTTDLVFIDAPATGYSRFLADGAKTEYWGVEEDARAFADVVEAWLKSHNRTASPRFLVGESYGGVRSGFLAENLAQRGLKVNGVVLVSPSTSAGGPNPMGNKDPAVLALPTYAAVARSHGKGAFTTMSVEQVSADAAKFAFGDYAAALAKGDSLDPAEAARIAMQVSDYTGIPAESLLKTKLKVTNYGDTLLPGERLGRDDGRLHAPIDEMKKLPVPYDEPGSSMYTLTYDLPQAIDNFFRTQFGYRPMGPYVRLIQPRNEWNNQVVRGPVSIPIMFKAQMAADPNLRILMIAGYFDTTIPYMRPLIDYQTADLPADRFASQIFQSGHAVFYDPIAQKTAGDRLRAFYAQTLGPARR